MSKIVVRAGAAAGAVALSAATGVATNLLTDQPSWGVGAAVVVLVTASVALAVAISTLERRDSTPPVQEPPEPPAWAQSGSPQYAYSASGRTAQAGRDVRSGMPAGYVVLCLLIVGAVAVVVLLVAVNLAPSPGENTGTGNSSASSAPEDLSYLLSASLAAPRKAKVSARASGQPEPGLTYWFFMEVDYGKGYIEYYPRKRLAGTSISFDVTIPDDADLQYVRHGRVYGLSSTQDAQAEERRERQETTRVNDFFDKVTGRLVSDAVTLPY
jgi:hypothetical protein